MTVTAPPTGTGHVRISVIGPLRAERDGVAVDLGPRKQRTLLAGLVLHAGHVVRAGTLTDLMWGDAPPAAVQASLHGYVAALRRVLEPGRAARSEATVLVTRAPGYRLDLPADAVDAHAFTRVVEDVRRRVGGDPLLVAPDLRPAQLDELDERLASALALWRGEPYPELPTSAEADAERARLAELRTAGLVDLARIGVARGRPAEVAANLAPVAREQPLREDVWAVLALALARAGRQADALRAIGTVKAALADELGVDPGPVLAALEVAVLRQDATVVGAPQRAGTPSSATPARPPAATPARAPAPAPARPSRPGGDDLPFVGRAAELDALGRLLARAQQGRVQLAVLVGEPGIGKTRLTHRLADLAAEAGFLVLTGRCSSDEGPPLWPWKSVLRELAREVPDATVPDLGPLLDRPAELPVGVDRFRLFDAVVSAVTAAAGRRPLVLVLDDLHWADASTLRLLQHLVEHAAGALCVVGTRRAHPEPAGALQELSEALARRGALRLDLQGLAVEDVAALAAATGAEPAAAHAVRDRTGGNPFFAVEVLRLVAAGGAPASTPVPASVGDVVAARAAQLPEGTRSVLQAAAALGRSIDLDLLARLQEAPPDDVLDALEPALAAGLVVVDADGAVRFRHALVRDAVDAAVSPLRRQRRHARLAHLLEGADSSGARIAEIAGHWLRAGPAHAGRAWRTAAAAADDATALAAHEEAADLLRGAVVSQRLDPAAGSGDRYDLLLRLARARRAAGDGAGQAEAAERAVSLADEAGDVPRLAEAAVAASEGALWSNRSQGELHAPTLRALRTALGALPPGDSVLRCRVLLALARELFWAPGGQEARACAEQALAMAGRVDDDALLALASRTMIVNDYQPASLTQRTRLAEQSVAAARRAGDHEAEAVGLFMAALTHAEAGRTDDRDHAASDALHLAGARRLRYLQVMVGAHQVPWLAIHGRFDEAHRLLEDVGRWAAYAWFPFRDEAVLAAGACLQLWRGRAGELLDAAETLDARSSTDMGTFLLLLLLRAGRLGQADALLDARPVSLADDHFAAPMDLATGAEAALLLGRRDLAAGVYPLLAQWPGRSAQAGTGAPLGPVDAFLALAAAAVGETALATEHADAALRLCRDWHLPPVVDWLTGLRSRYGF